MRGQHRLVGGDDREAARQRRLDRFVCDAVGAADQFDQDVDFGGGGHRRRIFEEARAAEIEPALTPMAHAIGRKNALSAHARGESAALPLQKLNEAASDHAEAGYAQAQRLCHNVLARNPYWNSAGPCARVPIPEGRSAPPLGHGFLLLALLAGCVAGVALELLLVLEPLLLFP